MDRERRCVGLGASSDWHRDRLAPRLSSLCVAAVAATTAASNRLLSAMLARLFANRTSCLLLRLTRSLQLAASNRRLSAIVERLIVRSAASNWNERAIVMREVIPRPLTVLQSRRAALVFGGEVTEPLTELETSCQSEPAPLHVQKVLLEPWIGLSGGFPRTLLRVLVAVANLLAHTLQHRTTASQARA